MDSMEIVILMGCGIFSAIFLLQWYGRVTEVWHTKRGGSGRLLLKILPLFCAAIVLVTLINFASFDVVDSFLYILFYLAIGMAWLRASLFLMFMFFDLSWLDDAIERANPAAVIAVAGGAIGATLIYSGANIGDGPGWWCVFFAGGLGMLAWLVLGKIAGGIADVFERITVGRDVACALRTAGFLIATGLLLGRASAGDWTSASSTVIEFADGWPAIGFGAIFVIMECAYGAVKVRRGAQQPSPVIAACIGALYIAAAVLCLIYLPPLPINPIYA